MPDHMQFGKTKDCQLLMLVTTSQTSTLLYQLTDVRKDEKALEIIQKCFQKEKLVGIDSTEIIWGLGSFHCLSQQEPLL